MRPSRGTVVFAVLCLVSASACHQYIPVTDLTSTTGTRTRVTLSAEGRANNAHRLGGVPKDLDGVFVSTAPGDSVVIKVAEVRFADIGTVPFAGAELRFAARDITAVAQERANKSRSVLLGVLATAAVIVLADLVTGGGRLFGSGGRAPGNSEQR
jgi:hypothetical protein